MAHKHYIDGKWVDDRSGESFPSINPATGEIISILPKAGPEEINAAVEAASAAFDSWRRTPAPRRAEVLYRVGQTLLQRKEELARLVTIEMGKVLAEARGDVQEAIDMTLYMAGEGRRLFGHTTPSELPNKVALTHRDPIGVVAAITPWNFPLAIPCWKIMPALVAGNTVVFKPASDTPVIACTLVEILEEAGLPPGVLNLVLGPGGEVGKALINHPQVNAVSLTGSSDTGQMVAQEIAPQMKRLSLEMGGKNAILLMEDADLDLALDGILWSAFGTTGQRCTAASRLIVHRSIKKTLLERLVPRTEALRLSNGLLPTTDIGPVINESQLQKIHRYSEIGRKEGATLLIGGQIYTKGDCARGFFYLPTIFDDVQPVMRIAQEEIFGPVLSVITVDSLEEAIQVNNGTRHGLSSSIYTRDINKAMLAARDITTGIVYVNAGTIGAEVHLPFGGTRWTGNGHREAGQAALDFYTEWKTLYIDFSGKLQRAQIDIEA